MDIQKKDQILSSALTAFFKYGFKRISMKEIAEFAGISRAGLYLDFKTKEDVFRAAILHYADRLITEIQEGIEGKKSVEDRILFAFEIWSIRNFDQTNNSPEAKEISDGGFTFARESYDASYKKLESLVGSLLKTHFKLPTSRKILSAEETSHLLVSASRGFKLTASNSKELRKMIQNQIKLVLDG